MTQSTDTTATNASANEDRTLNRLRESLALAAANHDLLDVAFRTLDSPVGRLLIASTPRGIVRLAFTHEPLDDVLAELAAKVSPRILEDNRSLDAVARELDEYFSGRRDHFDTPVDFTLSGGFRREVLHHLTQIPFGATESYSDVAAAINNPKAVRAVGSACATNPIPLIVPCHRVLRSDGTLGGYRGGLATKRLLLDLEAAA